MVGVLEERDIKVFYNTFNFEELLLHSKKEVKILDVIDLHERMKEMNIVPSWFFYSFYSILYKIKFSFIKALFLRKFYFQKEYTI